MTRLITSGKNITLNLKALRKSRFNVAPYLYLLPALIFVTIVSFYPILHAFRLSLYNTQYLELTSFAGLSNYVEILGTSAGWSNIFRSLIYVFGSLIITLPYSLFLAVLLNRPLRYKRVFRVIIVMPWVVSQTIAALLWKWSLNPNYGPVLDLFVQLGGHRVDLLSYTSSAMISLIGVNVWLSYPYAVVILLAALQTVPKDVYEAASVDGASAWTAFRKITLPLIQPSLLVVLIILTLLYFNMVTLILTFTGGGPFSGTEVLSLRAFKEAFEFWRIGLGAAFSVTIFLFNVVFSLWYIKLLRTDVYS
ncbi:MAG: sugar ABC transporter permease [Anaerolineae bacterium]|nr:sugar ABC transporter permease [Anaerolineae bacterium]